MAERESLHNPFQDGLRLFNEEYFFEAHEHLEGLWLAERGPARAFLQGLIQICAGFHHFQNGNLIGAADLLKRGADKMRRYAANFMGLDVQALLTKIDEAGGQIERMRDALEPTGRLTFPKIPLPPTD